MSQAADLEVHNCGLSERSILRPHRCNNGDCHEATYIHTAQPSRYITMYPSLSLSLSLSLPDYVLYPLSPSLPPSLSPSLSTSCIYTQPSSGSHSHQSHSNDRATTDIELTVIIETIPGRFIWHRNYPHQW